MDDLELILGEVEMPADELGRTHALRLLAHWLLSAVQKGAPVVDPAPVEDSQNRLDVARRAKVGSDGR